MPINLNKLLLLKIFKKYIIVFEKAYYLLFKKQIQLYLFIS